MLLSAIFWLLPVSSIITPATLNVDMVSFDVFALRRVPRIDFASSNFATLPDSEFGSTSNKSWSNVITGSSSYTQSIVAGAATQGTVLAIDPPAVNSSWKLDFHGPAIVCNTVNESLSTLIKQNIEGATNASTTVGRILYDYLSWVPTGNNLESWTPFNQSENGTYIQRTAISSPVFPNADVQTVENLSHMPLSIFVATFPHMREWDGTAHNMNQVMRDSTILRCVLHNATYHANFKFVNGFQSIDMTDENLHGAVDFVDGITNLPTSTSGIYMNSSYINSEWLMETFSYQSILDAFGQILVGSISSHIVTTGGKDSPKIYSADASISGTNILSTVLAKCEELSFLRSVINGVLQDEFTSYWRGKSNYPSYSTSQSLRDGLEEIFRNITFSFMSSNLFQPNYTVHPLPDVNVTITSYHNVYKYTQSILWTAYGIAIGVTLVSVIAGVMVYFSNHGSYSTKFSTIFRVTQGASVSTKLNTRDYSGFDPLPDHVAQAEILPRRGTSCFENSSSGIALDHLQKDSELPN